MMQAYAEGFSLFDACEYQLDNAKIAHLWMQGSVVRSWLCELAARAFEQEGNDLANLEPYVEDSGEGRWTVEAAIDKRIPAPVIARDLRRVGRPLEAQAAARDLQPRARGGAAGAVQPDRLRAKRVVRRRVPRRRPRCDSQVLAPPARRDGARLAARARPLCR